MVIDIDDLYAHIFGYLEHSSILSMKKGTFSSVPTRKFYNNLRDPSLTQLDGGVQSCIGTEVVTILHEDLARKYVWFVGGEQLDIVESFRTSRDWSDINEVLHGVENRRYLITTVDTLTPDARIIRDILRHSLMYKAGDTKKITTQLLMVTYCILAERDFNISDLILSMMRYTFRLKSPDRQRLNTLLLDGVIQSVLTEKYPGIDWTQYPPDSCP
ncbi:hypothetical protein KSP39_PZI022221 [Platanthera zijinensis]|uniref:Uncharacterized protein n=1 Tax=Platanthera zijinensis TaxID=2320716 RepID=A0AAP0FV74_9ASPA